MRTSRPVTDRRPILFKVDGCDARDGECGGCTALAEDVAYNGLSERFSPEEKALLAEVAARSVESVVQVTFPVSYMTGDELGQRLSCSDRRRVVAKLAMEQAQLFSRNPREITIS